MKKITFMNQSGNFAMKNPDLYHNLYFPIASEQGIKSVVTPNLNGDSKIDQNTFLLEPTSIENLHNNRSGRNFWLVLEKDMPWSAVGNSAEAEYLTYSKDKDETEVEAGFMWQKMTRVSKRLMLKSVVTSYVPYNMNVEVMNVEIENNSKEEIVFTPIASVPVYGRSADNLRDHRHVTSLLHRIRTTENGVLVKPTLSFDERGHQKNNLTYYVCGVSGEGKNPVSFYPTVSEYLGDAGTYTMPEAVFKFGQTEKAKIGANENFEGEEAVGAFAFDQITLKANEKVSYTIIIGVTSDENVIASEIDALSTSEKVEALKVETENYWAEKVNVSFKTGDNDFDNYMRWVCFQPFLRRVYGCSFLPHHDYGKGGRGWRDLWQDCLALLIMDPKDVHNMIVDNFGGVRMDGTNATIIGSKQGEFIADRNNITRVWMDHGMWPFLTTKLYMDQTGDLNVLLEKASYFKDPQVKRGTDKDLSWTPEVGNVQKDATSSVYEGTVLEHLLLQHVCASLELGEHGNILLRGADWNDAIDMAHHRGESVAFTCAYAGNLLDLARYVRGLATSSNKDSVIILREFAELLAEIDQIDAKLSYEKKQTLYKDAFDKYQEAVKVTVSGETRELSCEYLATWLETRGNELMNHIQSNEWITDSKGNGWFNSYYDDNGRRVEGETKDGVRMMLTGQVFSIMSGVASKEQVASIVKSADAYLYEKEVGGYKLNTNFHEEKYDMGRMFGFAYGEKENGAVFSHMTVMFANSLYQRGFVKEGYKALQTLADTALNFETSQIYPGIPEYFNAKGKGLYHYLTGAASWYELTMVKEVFGVCGKAGNLSFAPKLVAKQFDGEGKAQIALTFAGKKLVVTYVNEDKLETGEYHAVSAKLDGKVYEACDGELLIARTVIEALAEGTHYIEVELGR